MCLHILQMRSSAQAFPGLIVGAPHLPRLGVAPGRRALGQLQDPVDDSGRHGFGLVSTAAAMLVAQPGQDIGPALGVGAGDRS